MPGTIDRYRWQEQGGAMANEIFGVGDDGAGHILLKRVKQLPGVQPLLQSQASFRAVGVAATVLSFAQQRVAKTVAPVVVSYVRVKGDKTPELGSYFLGDDVTFQINDLRFSNVATLFRLVGWSVNAPSQGSAEEVDLLVESP